MITHDVEPGRIGLVKALNAMKKELKQEGTLEELRRREHHRSPSASRRMKRDRAQARRVSDARKLARLRDRQ